MKELLLESQQILTADLQIYHPRILNKYYRVLAGNQNLYPIVVIPSNEYNLQEFQKAIEVFSKKIGLSPFEKQLLENASLKLEDKLNSWRHEGSEFLMCDGNHRSIAFYLHNKKIPAYQLESFEDIKKIIDKRKNSPRIMKESKSFDDYLFEFFRSIAKRTDLLRTVKGKVSELKERGELKIIAGTVVYSPDPLPF